MFLFIAGMTFAFLLMYIIRRVRTNLSLMYQKYTREQWINGYKAALAQIEQEEYAPTSTSNS